jgi:hypothetical protein
VANEVAVTVTVAVGGGGAACGVAVAVTPGVGCAGVLVGDDVWPGDDVLPEVAVLPADAVDVPVPLGEVLFTDGVKTVGEDEVEEVQADTAIRASMVSAPQQRAVSLAARGLPAVVPRTFMDPPSAPGR